MVGSVTEILHEENKMFETPKEDTSGRVEIGYSSPKEGEPVEISAAVRFFHQDLEMARQALANSDKDQIYIRAIGFKPADVSEHLVIIAIPKETTRRDPYGIETEGAYHDEIVREWVWTRDQERLKVLTYAEEKGIYNNREHLNFKLTKASDGSIKVTVIGWSTLLQPGESLESLAAKITRYGIRDFETKDATIDSREVERLVLEDMTGPIIRKRVDLLRKVITPASLTLYERLAKRFLTDLHANKSTPAYLRFQEFEELAQKLEAENS